MEYTTFAIPPELEAKILRYFHVERWRVGTTARQLGMHHATVDRVLSQAGLPRVERPHRATLIDPYLPLVLKTLEQYPRLSAARLYAMVRERGYSGGADHFRHLLAHYPPRAQPEAYLRLKTLPGEQAQVDWGHFGKVTIGNAERRLMAFVMVLSCLRAIFLRFYLDAHEARLHARAYRRIRDVGRTAAGAALRQSEKCRAGAPRGGDPLLSHPLALAAHYRFEPRPVAPARGNEKGRVERAIRYVRDAFFAARTWRDLEDLNAQADA